MLQIITGKFFRDVPLTERLHRGVYYTNLRFPSEQSIETRVGRLLPSTGWGGLSTPTYEITERLESVERNGSRSIMISTGGAELVNDFAAVVSFALNVTCTPDPDLTRRLVGDRNPGLGMSNVPSRYLQHTFNPEIIATEDADERLVAFIDKLVSLRRAVFEDVMRAIRQYVIATHRLGDSPDLAYTLFVAALESLAQSHDGHVGTWTDYEEAKRNRIDTALHDAPAEIADKVRAGILEVEQVALRRRFISFALAHLAPSFFRRDAEVVASPVSRTVLPRALDAAYRIRSRYVHRLKPLPKILGSPDHRFEIMEDDGNPILTFNGLARLVRHAILTFVNRQPAGEDPDFDYRQELPNIVRVRMASRYWIGQAEGLTVQSARSYLSAHFDEVGQVLAKAPDAAITDIPLILAKIEELVPGLAKASQRIPLLVLYASFHERVSEPHCRPNAEVFITRYSEELGSPAIETLFLYVSTGRELPWPLEEIEGLRRAYFDQKFSKHSLNVGFVAETMLTLCVAERYRIGGDESRARELIAFAVENYPASASLRAFEGRCANLSPLPEINGLSILRGNRSEDPAAPES